jgi:hypothetical protein
MPLMPSAVLEEPAYRVPPAPPAGSGLAWLRGQVPRFCDGAEHARRRAAVDGLLAHLTVIPNSTADPVAWLLHALGLPVTCLGDVDAVAAAWLAEHGPVPGAEAAR